MRKISRAFLRIKKEYLILAIVLFVIFLLRFPSIYEPFWYGDEGIFAAVGRNLNLGGTLYATAWDNKPPMIYLTYAAIFKYLGVSMFSLRLVTIIVVLTTTAAIYEIAQTILSTKRALVAAFIFGFLSSLRIVEGNLALTEIYMILPITLAILVSVKRKFDLVSLFLAGILFAIGSLYKQVGAFEAVALGIFLFLSSRNFSDFVKKGVVLALGFLIPYFLTLAYFAPKHLVGDFIFAAYTYYRIYLNESPKYALLVNVSKFMPVIVAVIYGFWKKRKDEFGIFHLILLWMAFSVLGSYFSGRTYGHYLVETIPATSLLIASISFKVDFKKMQIMFALFFFIPIIFLTRLLFADFLTGGPINQYKYWQNFLRFSTGAIDVWQYNDFFDRNANSIMLLRDFFASQNARGSSVYIWGDWPWLLAIGDFRNPSRYVTSFHVFGVPNGKSEVAGAIETNLPKYIIKTPTSIGYFPELEKLIFYNYTLLSEIEDSQIFRRNR